MLQVLFTLLLALSASADAALTVKTKSGHTYACLLNHTVEGEFGPNEHYLCESGKGRMIVTHSPYAWHGVEQTKAGETPAYATIIEVQGDGQLLFGLQKDHEPPTRTQSLEDRYSLLRSAMQTLDFRTGIIGGPPLERNKGTPEYEKAHGEFFKSLQEERSRIEAKFKGADSILVELSNGKTIRCERGKSRPPTEEMKKALLFRNEGCELYKCPPIEAQGRTYEPLIYSPSVADATGPRISLTRPGALGPDVRIKRTYAGTKKQENLLYEQWKISEEAGKYFGPRQSKVPESLRESEDMLVWHLDAGWAGNWKYWQSRCDDRAIDAGIGQQEKAVEAAKDALAQAQAVQLVSWDKGAFVSEFIPQSRLPGGACRLSDGSFLTSEAASRVGEYDTLYRAPAGQTVSLEEAERIFEKVAAMRDISFGYYASGCEARAHLVADRLEKMGIATEKIWITGDLHPAKDPSVGWRFHVAVAIKVRRDDGSFERRVIDPSLSDRLLTVDEWTALIPSSRKGPVAQVEFPPPDNTVFYQRASVSFSKSSVYVPDTGPGLVIPSAGENMADAIRINQENLGVFP